MVQIVFDLFSPSPMDEPISNSLLNFTGMSGTLQDIAYKIVEDRENSNLNIDNETKERTIFVLGSKGVVRLAYR